MKKISKRFEKGLDNPLPMWYNKDTKGEGTATPKGSAHESQ